MVSRPVTRLPVLLCLATLLCLQVPWAFCLEGGVAEGAPLVVSVRAACGHHHPAAPSPDEPLDESHSHEHVLLLSVGTIMPPAVSLHAPRLMHEAVLGTALVFDQSMRTENAPAFVPGGAPPEIEPGRTAQLLL